MISGKRCAAAPRLDPQTFGAVGDGLADDTAPLQTALDRATAGHSVWLGDRTYAVRGLRVRPGVAGLVGTGALRGLCEEAVIRVSGEPGSPVEALHIAGITVEAGPARRGIVIGHTRDTRIEGCRIHGLRDLAQGIEVGPHCARVTIVKCRIEAAREPLESLVCIAVHSDLPDAYAGYFTEPVGTAKCKPASTQDICIEGNHVEGGTHGIAVAGVWHARIAGNTITDNSHRNINICPAACHNLVTGNTLLEAGSSAVAMAYGSNENVVASNTIRSHSTRPDHDRDAIHSYVSCRANRVEDNRIDGDFRYGIYLAVASADTRVSGNRICLAPKRGLKEDFQVGVGIENDWPPRPLPQDAIYSRRNWGSIHGRSWAYGDTVGNVVRDNHVSGCTCGYYVAQFGATYALRANRWIGNEAIACHHALYAFGQAEDLFMGNRLEQFVVRNCACDLHLPPWTGSPFSPPPL